MPVGEIGRIEEEGEDGSVAVKSGQGSGCDTGLTVLSIYVEAML